MNKEHTKIVKLNNGSRYDQLRLNVDYSLGGMNYFTGSINRRGYYLYLAPCSTGTGFLQTTLMGSQEESGFKILLQETTRKSAKRLSELYAKLEPYLEKIGELFSGKEYQTINTLVQEKVDPKYWDKTILRGFNAIK